MYKHLKRLEVNECENGFIVYDYDIQTDRKVAHIAADENALAALIKKLMAKKKLCECAK